MAWYVVHVGRMHGIYLTQEVNRYPNNCYKKYNTEAEALRVYYGPMSANHGHPPTVEIEEEPPAEDMKIRRIAPWSWKDLFMVMVIAFLIWKLMQALFHRTVDGLCCMKPIKQCIYCT